MPKKKKEEGRFALKVQHLGTIYRLIEQFELISRIDLSKLSGFAPASITAITKELIQLQLITERAVQTTIVRGRPAVGLCLSSSHWRTICGTLLENTFELTLCELNDKVIEKRSFSLQAEHMANLDVFLVQSLKQFLADIKIDTLSLLAFSLTVAGRFDRTHTRLVKLGQYDVDIDLSAVFVPHFSVPVFIREYFQTWLFAESTLGSIINCNNALFLQLDDVINMSVLVKGKILNSEKETRMNINRVNVPKLSELQDKINLELPEIKRNQLHNQVTHQSIYQMVDLLFPQNTLPNNSQKIDFVCEQANQGNPQAIQILYHVADCVSYVLMNLVNIFSSEKVVISSSLLLAKDLFLARLNQKLQENLLLDDLHVDIVTSRYAWNSPILAASAIKQRIYDGSLLMNL
ncbi:ROK family protein [Conservatibacter flavescens]|uniref:ROK family protein n=1 Tax=Conservatibacter flavescens TaxID=28161 RepID=A0A2M8S5W1_9PAST|nr:ROK family protein [Conservatibacter flavescens]PJG86542.1 ROK family protein [Conservatibacter flavescens]